MSTGTLRQVFLDTETTGLAHDGGDRILEIGCIELVNRRLSGRTLHHYINPQRPSHPDALRVHGITEQFLADKPVFEAVADEIIGFVKGAEIIIHNAPFDVGFLNAELARSKRGAVHEHVARVTCSLVMAREMFPGKSNSLDALCKRLEVDNSGRDLHGALLDAGLLAEVYLRLTRGQGALVIDMGGANSGSALQMQAIDLGTLVLPVIDPTPQEQAAHEQVLAQIDKDSGGKTLWRLQQPALPAAAPAMA